MTCILHLMTEDEWRKLPLRGTWSPPSLAAEGFVHCTGDDDLMLAVANNFYRHETAPLVVLTLDTDRLRSEVRWEAPVHPDGTAAREDEPRFPHVYGPIDVAAVVGVRHLVRDTDGRFTGYEAST
jgi:uncharacterized protein (DUF952 family)